MKLNNGRWNWMTMLTRWTEAGRIVTVACALALAACSTQVASEPARSETAAQDAVHPVSGLPVIPLTVMSGNHTHRFAVEVAKKYEDRQRGLMFRTELAPDEGMLFLFERSAILSFWMKNTPLPLDIIFISSDGRIVNIVAKTQPYSLQSVYSDDFANTVLELPGGRAAELGIKAGDKVEYRLP